VTGVASKYQDFSGLVRPEGVDMKPTLLRVLTDLYVQKPAHDSQEEKHFTELALRLIEEVDDRTLATTAARLDAYGAAPPAVMRRLAVRLGDRAVRAEPVADEAAPAEPAASTLEADRAAAAEFSDLFFAAEATQREALFRQLDALSAVLPPLLAADDAKAATVRLEAAALKGRPFEFVRELEQSLGIPRPYSEKIVTDTSGEPMLAVARAIAMPVDIVQRILLLLNPAIGTSVRRVFDLTACYERLSEQAALRLIALWRHGGARHAARAPVGAVAADPRVPPAQRQPLATPRRDQRAS